MQLYKTTQGIVLRNNKDIFQLPQDWDQLINQRHLFEHLSGLMKDAKALTEKTCEELLANHLLPPIGSQEVWAAGVTYLRSRDARMEESKDSGGADCYQKVYDAERPELFFKALPQRVVGHRQNVNIRSDSSWNVPEPELTLYINSNGEIQGYTIGNDMSSRSIEGENPLYLPQAKMYEKSAALGPCLYVPAQSLSKETNISIVIGRKGVEMFNQSIQLNRMKRSLPELASYLFRACDFPAGCFLMTGTGIVPPSDFTLLKDDEITIGIDGIGSLTNTVSVK